MVVLGPGVGFHQVRIGIPEAYHIAVAADIAGIFLNQVVKSQQVLVGR